MEFRNLTNFIRNVRNLRNFIREEIAVSPRFECFSIVPEAEEENTPEYDKMYLKLWATIPEQTHSMNVGIVERPGQIFSDTDAVITFLKDTPIGVVTADCVPIVLYAPDIECAAAVHAGWKGTLGGILDNALSIMENHGADLSKVNAVFGPSISKDVYEVDRELGEMFEAAGFGAFVHYPSGPDGKPHIDLQGVNAERMMRRGVPKENILLNADCTFGCSRYHSYRRDGSKAGRQLTAITLKAT